MDDFKCRITSMSRDMITGKTQIIISTDKDICPYAEELKDCELNCRLKKYRKKRSLDANAYCWVLLDKLAHTLNVPKEELYRDYIKNIGGNSITGCYKECDADKMCSGWESKGLGWQTERFESKIDGCVNIIFYEGSSQYDSEQMSSLINLIVQDCDALGIETKTPNEILKMLALWGENN